jgi:hypothetical protein
MTDLGRVMMIGGVIVFALGALLYASGRVPFLGKLPGDFVIDRGHVKAYFPLATGLILSVILTIVLNLFFRR